MDVTRIGSGQDSYVSLDQNTMLTDSVGVRIAKHFAAHCCCKKVRETAQRYLDAKTASLVEEYADKNDGILPFPTRGSKGFDLAGLAAAAHSPGSAHNSGTILPVPPTQKGTPASTPKTPSNPRSSWPEPRTSVSA